MSLPDDSGGAAIHGGPIAAEQLPVWAWFVFGAALVALLAPPVGVWAPRPLTGV